MGCKRIISRVMPAAVLAAGMTFVLFSVNRSTAVASPSLPKTARSAETANSLVSDFYTYPNPFSLSTDAITTFHFALTDPARLDIRIFTRAGELVWNTEIPAENSVGSSGVQVWDGTNNQGNAVAFGSYICKIIAIPLGGGTSYSQTTVIGIKP